MRTEAKYPLLYQVNTRAWLTSIGRDLGRPATLDDIADTGIARIAALGFDWVWFLGVWRTGEAGRRVSRSNPAWQEEYRQVLPDLTEDDIEGSCFAIAGYDVHPGLGGEAALQRLWERLAAHGLRLMLDFVPNHMAPDHPWVTEHPDWFIRG
ncbi:MAG TPA: alpha-amylase family glycosyl hydrolase, partial [Rhodospirillales bacterium]|nr:alpha-amylase family glycosyl hydrolase [Rhodospirillales bacterium]